MTVAMQLVAAPIGTYALPGARMKVNAEVKAMLECSECDLQIPGRLENAVMRGDMFIGGHFVSDARYVAA